MSGGKSPFFLKAADKKRLALLAKYQELKVGGRGGGGEAGCGAEGRKGLGRRECSSGVGPNGCRQARVGRQPAG